MRAAVARPRAHSNARGAPVESPSPAMHFSPRGAAPNSPAGSPVLPPSFSEILFWLSAAICLVAQVAVIRAALAGLTPGASPSTFARVREFFWVLLPAALLALLLGWTWRSLPGRAPDEGSRAGQATHVIEGRPVDYRAHT